MELQMEKQCPIFWTSRISTVTFLHNYTFDQKKGSLLEGKMIHLLHSSFCNFLPLSISNNQTLISFTSKENVPFIGWKSNPTCRMRRSSVENWILRVGNGWTKYERSIFREKWEKNAINGEKTAKNWKNNRWWKNSTPWKRFLSREWLIKSREKEINDINEPFFAVKENKMCLSSNSPRRMGFSSVENWILHVGNGCTKFLPILHVGNALKKLYLQMQRKIRSKIQEEHQQLSSNYNEANTIMQKAQPTAELFALYNILHIHLSIFLWSYRWCPSFWQPFYNSYALCRVDIPFLFRG